MRAGLPPFIHVGSLGGQHPGSGFLEAKYGPVPVEDPNSGLRNTRLVKGESLSAIHKRIALSTQLDAAFVERYGTNEVRAYADLYADAARLIESKELEAFDLAKELPKTRDTYGQDGFGQGVLLARRLVERGAQFVEVDLGGWDTHTNNHRGVESRAAILDRALAALLADLESRGLLGTTLVAVVSEFGRSPELDKDAGRNHHPIAFSTMCAFFKDVQLERHAGLSQRRRELERVFHFHRVVFPRVENETGRRLWCDLFLIRKEFDQIRRGIFAQKIRAGTSMAASNAARSGSPAST